MTTQPKLKDIAAKIDAHLKRFEADPKINTSATRSSIRPYYGAGAGVAGAYVSVTYVSFQGARTLDRDEALRYLAWLDAGNVGQHYKAIPNTGAARAERARQVAAAKERARIEAEEKRAAAVVFEPVTADEARSFAETYRAGSDVWRLARTVLGLMGETQ